MDTAEERIRFVIRFASTDLEQLRPGDWLNLRDDLQAFLALDQVVIVEGPRPQDYTADDFRALQVEVREFLSGLVQARKPSGHWPLAHHSKFITFQHLAYYVTPLDAIGHPGRTRLGVQGSTRDAFWSVFIFLLWDEGIERLMACPECGTIFYRNRKQRYCTRRCVDRVNQRSFRASKRQPA
jgi:hypothetical protein